MELNQETAFGPKLVLAVRVDGEPYGHADAAQLLEIWSGLHGAEISEVFPVYGSGQAVFGRLSTFLDSVAEILEQAPSSWSFGAAWDSGDASAEMASKLADSAGPGSLRVSEDLFEASRLEGHRQLTWWCREVEPAMREVSRPALEIRRKGVEEEPFDEKATGPIEIHAAEWRPSRRSPVPGATAWRLHSYVDAEGFRERWIGLHPKRGKRRLFSFFFDETYQESLDRNVFWLRQLKEKLWKNRRLIRLYGYRLHDTPAYLTTEVESGVPLSRQTSLVDFRLPIRLHIAVQAGEALAAAHQLGIIHGDFGAHQVLVRFDSVGTPVVKLRNVAVPAMEETEGSSPKTAGIRQDLRAFGVFLYRMVRGDLSLPLEEDWRNHIADPHLEQAIEAVLTLFTSGTYRRLEHVTGALAGLGTPPQERPTWTRHATRRRRSLVERFWMSSSRRTKEGLSSSNPGL